MATDEKTSFDTLDDGWSDDELHVLFSAFDEVSASSELRETTLGKIGELRNTNGSASNLKAIAGGKRQKANGIRKGSSRAKRHAIRIGAIAACLVLALTGGVAYATPASYYEVSQGNTTITLGVNCFGLTISTESNDETGREIIESADLDNKPYEESISRTIENMEQREPAEPIEFGPQGGEHERIQPDGDDHANEPVSENAADRQSQDTGQMQGETGHQGAAGPEGDAPPNDGRDGGETVPPPK